MKGIIPTGGNGTRMRPLTFSSNKHFIPVANKPLIFYPIETVVGAGISDIAITYNPRQLETVKNFLGDGSKWGAKFTYILQEEPKGLANIFQVCEEYVSGEPFVLHLGDNIFVDGISEAVDYFLKNKPNGLVTMVHHPDNTRLGVPYFDEKGRLIEYVEKPSNPPHDFAIPGLYFFDSNVFKCFSAKGGIKPSQRGEYEISAPYQWLIDNGYRVDVIEYKGKWLDPGKFDDWIEANKYLLDIGTHDKIESQIDEATTVENKVSIGKNCEIKNSKIIGPVVIGNDVVLIDARVGPYASVSDNCVINNSRVENCVIMSGVRIEGVKEPINTSLIGADSEIIKSGRADSSIKLFIGEKCRLEL